MNLAQSLQTSFVLLEGDWPADQSRKLVRDLPAAAVTHVVAHWGQPGSGKEYYCLFTRKEVLDLLSVGGTVAEALGLRAEDAAPVLASALAQGEAPQRGVVIRGGQIAGFVDKTTMTLGGPTRGDGAERGGETANGGAPEVQRSLVADVPESVPLGETASMLVILTAEAPAGGQALPLTLAVGATIDIMLQTGPGLKIEGRREGSFAVTADPESPPLMFKLRGMAIGPSEVRVLAFRDGQSLGQLEFAVMVLEATAASGDSARGEAVLAAPSAQRPDLSLHIFSEVEDGQTVLTFRLSAVNPDERLDMTELGTKTLVSDPARYFGEFFSDIETLEIDSPEKMADAELKVQSKGANLFAEVVPEQVREKLWQLRDRITSIQIVSQEPFIPWELCRLSGKDGDMVVDGPILCEKFNITRSPLGCPMWPKLTLENIAIVVPADSGLPFAQAEREYLLGLAGERRTVKEIEATTTAVVAEFGRGTYDGWHFSGHGAARSQDANRSAIFLAGGATLTPESLNGAAVNLGRAKPLIFLNACQVGRGGLSLTDIGGWGDKFLKAGAAAFVGTYWKVSDRQALEFAQALYGRLLAGMAIGQAAREARLAVKGNGNPTWLAYTVFADPWARVGTAAGAPGT